MLSTLDLLELKVRARDGDAGKVSDLVFSDTDWTVRDMEIDTGAWIFGRRVVVDPDMVLEAETPLMTLDLALSRDQMKSLPEATGSDEPARQPGTSAIAQPQGNVVAAGAAPEENEEAHRHRLSELVGYQVVCEDEAVGTLAGFLIDTVAWDMPVALIQPGKDEPMVLMPSRLIGGIAWPERSVQATVEASMIRNAPVFDRRIQDERVLLPVVTDYYASRSPAA